MPIDPLFIYTLRSKLHAIRKCFSGKDFVDMVIEAGKEWSEGDRAAAVTSDTSQMVTYTLSYAKAVGQYLLDEGILLCEVEVEVEEQQLASSSVRLNSSSNEQITEKESFHSSLGTPLQSNKPSQLGSSSTTSVSSSTNDAHNDNRSFQNSHHYLYRFVNIEDRDDGFVFHSLQILTATSCNSHKRNNNTTGTGETLSDFDQARLSTQTLITIVLQQRAKFDRRAKAFLSNPYVIQVQENGTLNSPDILKILRI